MALMSPWIMDASELKSTYYKTKIASFFFFNLIPGLSFFLITAIIASSLYLPNDHFYVLQCLAGIRNNNFPNIISSSVTTSTHTGITVASV